MNSVNKIDWELFKLQKYALLRLRDDPKIMIEDAEMLDGVVNLMDAIQDDFEPCDIDEDEED